MNEETIVAVFDTAAHADAAIRDLEAADVPSSAISRHSSTKEPHPRPRPARRAFGRACSVASPTRTALSMTVAWKAARMW